MRHAHGAALQPDALHEEVPELSPESRLPSSGKGVVTVGRSEGKVSKLCLLQMGHKGWVAYDDVTGLALDAHSVYDARLKEVDYIDRKPVWVKIPRKEAIEKGWPILKARWIDINKRGRYCSNGQKQVCRQRVQYWSGGWAICSDTAS